MERLLDKPDCNLPVGAGDLILAVNGQDAATIGPLSIAWLLTNPGENTTLRVRRGSQERELVLPVGEDSDRLSETEFLERHGIGAVIVSLESPPVHWVVDSVVNGGPAETAGLQKGDELIEVDGQRVVGQPSPQKLLATAHRNPARLVIRRGDHETGLRVPRVSIRELYGTPPPPPEFPIQSRHERAPAFSLPATNGEMISLDAHRGRWVLLNFWTVWCDPCRAEIPSLKKWAQELGPELVVIGVNIDESADDVKKFVQDEQLPYTVVLAGGFREPIAERYNIGGIPLNIVVSPEGWVTYVEYGFGPDSGLDAYLREVVPPSAGSATVTGASAVPTRPVRLSRTTRRSW
ncbi:MAG: redoxin domain-containing protein [Candidatus Acidiferrales bacterium]